MEQTTKLLENENTVEIIFKDISKEIDPANHRLLCAKLSTFEIDIVKSQMDYNLAFKQVKFGGVIKSYGKGCIGDP